MKKETEKDAFKKACALSVDGNIGLMVCLSKRKCNKEEEI